MREREERKNRRIALVTTLGIHGALFLVFLFMVAWRAPNPPLPEFGIELNFGLDSQGSGDVQPLIPAGSENPAENETEEVKSDQAEEKQETAVEESKPEESKPAEQQITSRRESPVVVKEEKKEETKPVEKPTEKTAETKPEVKTKETTENKSTATTEKTTADNTKGKPVSQGDDANKTGDKGDPKGSLDAKALYGTPGGGAGGAGLELDGWNWDLIPKPNVPNNESGRVVFEIKVDENGDIISIKTLERSVSLEAESICKKEIEKLTFTKTGANVPAVSVGKITFVVRSN